MPALMTSTSTAVIAGREASVLNRFMSESSL
jgi:hypothetical protein